MNNAIQDAVEALDWLSISLNMSHEEWCDSGSWQDDFNDKIETIRATLKSTPQWQPIETAPRDGTWILGHYCGRNWSVKNSIEGKHNCVVICWEDRTDLVESRWNSFGTSSYFEKDIDLWMPITQPPEGK